MDLVSFSSLKKERKEENFGRPRKGGHAEVKEGRQVACCEVAAGSLRSLTVFISTISENNREPVKWGSALLDSSVVRGPFEESFLLEPSQHVRPFLNCVLEN